MLTLCEFGLNTGDACTHHLQLCSTCHSSFVMPNVYLTSCLTTRLYFPPIGTWRRKRKICELKKEHESEVQIQGVSHFKGSPAPLLYYLKARRRGLLKKISKRPSCHYYVTHKADEFCYFESGERRHALTACFVFVFSSPQSKNSFAPPPSCYSPLGRQQAPSEF